VWGTFLEIFTALASKDFGSRARSPSTFLEMDAHDTLLDLYYAEHARLSHQTNEAPIWAA
jgi:hypothetical protein